MHIQPKTLCEVTFMTLKYDEIPGTLNVTCCLICTIFCSYSYMYCFLCALLACLMTTGRFFLLLWPRSNLLRGQHAISRQMHPENNKHIQQYFTIKYSQFHYKRFYFRWSTQVQWKYWFTIPVVLWIDWSLCLYNFRPLTSVYTLNWWRGHC